MSLPGINKQSQILVTYATVLRLPISAITDVESAISAINDVRVIYHRTSVARLEIIEEHEGDA
jgi:hypothetical protein